MDQENASPAPEGELLDNAPQVAPDDAPPEALAEAPQLSDEDYRLNFLGTDKFELARETPEEIRSALKNLEKSLNKGWTEKNMRLADERKQWGEKQEAATRDVEIQRATIKDLAKLEALQDEINQYDSVDWSRWAQENPQAAWQAQIARDGVKSRFDKLNAEVQGKQASERERQQQQANAWLAQSNERLQSAIPDWSADKSKGLQKFATEQYLNTNTPMDQGALQAMAWHPGLVQMANDAMLYRESLKRAATPPKEPTTPAVPVTKVAGIAPVAKSPEKMSDAEWMKWRNQELARKAREVPQRRR